MLSFDDAYCYICCSSSFYLFQFVHHSLLKRHIRVKSGCFRASGECAPHKSVLSFIPTRRFQSSSNNSYVLSSDSSMRIRILVCWCTNEWNGNSCARIIPSNVCRAYGAFVQRAHVCVFVCRYGTLSVASCAHVPWCPWHRWIWNAFTRQWQAPNSCQQIKAKPENNEQTTCTWRRRRTTTTTATNKKIKIESNSISGVCLLHIYQLFFMLRVRIWTINKFDIQFVLFLSIFVDAVCVCDEFEWKTSWWCTRFNRQTQFSIAIDTQR